MNSKRWKTLRIQKLTADPLCEVCKSKGLVVAAACVHHIVPVESARNDEEMAQLAYSYPNLQSLCYKCHADIHKAERSHSREQHLERTQQRLQQWIEKRNKHKQK